MGVFARRRCTLSGMGLPCTATGPNTPPLDFLLAVLVPTASASTLTPPDSKQGSKSGRIKAPSFQQADTASPGTASEDFPSTLLLDVCPTQVLPGFCYGLNFSGALGVRSRPQPQVSILEHRKELEKDVMVRRLRGKVTRSRKCCKSVFLSGGDATGRCHRGLSYANKSGHGCRPHKRLSGWG